jgi:hypothetical protein
MGEGSIGVEAACLAGSQIAACGVQARVEHGPSTVRGLLTVGYRRSEYLDPISNKPVPSGVPAATVDQYSEDDGVTFTGTLGGHKGANETPGASTLGGTSHALAVGAGVRWLPFKRVSFELRLTGVLGKANVTTEPDRGEVIPDTAQSSTGRCSGVLANTPACQGTDDGHGDVTYNKNNGGTESIFAPRVDIQALIAFSLDKERKWHVLGGLVVPYVLPVDERLAGFSSTPHVTLGLGWYFYGWGGSDTGEPAGGRVISVED